MTTALAAPVPVDNLGSVLRTDFTAACEEFAAARHLQRGKDTPTHRASVADAQSRIDSVLDMYLAIRQGLEEAG